MTNLTNFWYSPRRDALSVSSPSKRGAFLVRSSLLSVTPTTLPDAPCRHGATATREVVVGTGLRRGSHSPHGGHHRQLLLRGAPRRPLPETRHIVAIVWQQCCLAATSGDRFMKHTAHKPVQCIVCPTDNATVLSPKHTDKTTSLSHSLLTLTMSACYTAVPFAIITLIFHDMHHTSTHIHN